MFNARLIYVRDGIENSINILNIASGLKYGALKLDTKVISSGRISGVKNGLGLSNAGRSITIEVPILYKNVELESVGIINQLNRYYSFLVNSNLYRYYIEYDIECKKYRAEFEFNNISGYNIKDVNNAGSLSLTFNQIDNFYYCDEWATLDLEVVDTETEDNTQDIILDIDTYTITLPKFEVKVIRENNSKPFFFYLANKINYGISFTDKNQLIGLGEHTIKYEDKIFSIDDVAYAYDGIIFELVPEKNTLYYECNCRFLSGNISYRKGVIL